MAPNGYNYANYYAPSQQNHSYSAYQAPRSTTVPSSSQSEYQPSTVTTPTQQNGTYPGLQRYEYAQSANSYPSIAAASGWYESDTAGNTGNYSRGTVTSSRDNRESRHQLNMQPTHDRSNYDASALGSLAYASGLNSDSGARQSVSNSTEHAQYTSTSQSQPYHTQTSPAPAHQASLYGTTHSLYRQQQVRSDSTTNSVGSARSASSISRASHLNNAGIHYQHQRIDSDSRGRTSSPMQNQSGQPSQITNNTVSTSNLLLSTSAGRESSTISANHPESQTSAPQTAVSAGHQDRQSNEPVAPMTVDPSHVYDPYHEYQRQAKRAEAEAAKRTEEVQKADAAEIVKGAEEARRLAKDAQTGKVEKTKKAKKINVAEPPRKRANIKITKADALAQAAAMTLMQTSNSVPSSSSTDLETQIREMFRKMREFNAQDPEMLSKLWQQEREQHLAKEGEKKAGAQTPDKDPPNKSSQPAKPTPRLMTTQTKQTQQPPPEPALQSPPEPAEDRASSRIPTISQSSGTIWPADKKATLAAAAANLLRAIPVNRGKDITSSQISSILDLNPSYIELCQNVESRGIKLDRSQFAKALLAAVPDVNRTVIRPNTARLDSASQITQNGRNVSLQIDAHTVQVATSGSLKEAEARLMSGENLVDTPRNSKRGRPRKDGTSVKPRKSKSSSEVIDTKPAGNEITPELRGSSPLPRPASSHKSPPRASITDPGLDGLEAVKQFVKGGGSQPVTDTVRYQLKVASRPRPLLTNGERVVLASAPSKEAAASKRTFGDLVDLTIELSDDEEPAFPPLKRHEPLQQDLEPSQIPTPQISANSSSEKPALKGPRPAQLEPTNSQPQTESQSQPQPQYQMPDHPARLMPVVKQLDKYKAIRRSTYNPRTIARDVLLACGRHPDMRHLNAHLETLKQAFKQVDNMADLTSFRWDVVDPGGPPPGSGAEALIVHNHFLDDADDEDDDEVEPPLARQLIGPGDASAIESHPPLYSPAFGKARIRKPGRLPRSSDPGVRSRADGAGPDPRRPRHSEAEAGQSRSSNSVFSGTVGTLSATQSGYTAIRAAQAAQSSDGTPVKKKGRPIGWRKWMMKTPGSAASKSSKLTPNEPEPQPQQDYKIYKCEWQDCSAELHNLQTLRKHLHKLHCKKAPHGGYDCLWKSCGKVKTVTDRTTSKVSSKFEHIDFTSETLWKGHIEEKHLTPIAWNLGDGPAGGVSESEQSDAYMSDSHGRRVTPRVPLSAEQARIPGRAKRTAEEEAQEVQRSVEKKRRQIGPGVDRGGARLANEKRRQGFIDDDDTAEVIEVDD